MDRFERIYDSLTGQLLPEYREEGVVDAFEEGWVCSRASQEIYEARCRLEARLGCQDDKDLCMIMDEMEIITRELCRLIYGIGIKNAKE